MCICSYRTYAHIRNTIGTHVPIVFLMCAYVPIGLGEPCFDKLEAKLAHAMMSIPATKGFEIGSGFSGAKVAYRLWCF